MFFKLSGDPYGTRTRVAAVKGRCPRPLDEGVTIQLRLPSAMATPTGLEPVLPP